MENTRNQEGWFHRIRQLFVLARPQRLMLTIGTLLLFVGISMTLIYPQLFRVIIDEALLKRESVVLQQSVILLIISFVIYAITGGLRYWLFTYSGERIVANLRSTLYQHILRQDIGYFDNQQTGKLLSRLSTDTEALQNTLSQELGLLLRYLFTVLGGIALLLYTSVELTVLLLLVVPPTAWLTGISGNYIRRYSSDTQAALAKASAVAEETFAGVRTVRSFAREADESDRYRNAIEKGLVYVKKRVVLVATLEGAVNLAASLGVVLVLWYGSGLVIDGSITVGALSSFLLYTFMVTNSMAGLANIWADFARAAGAADRVFHILEKQPGMSLSGGKRNLRLSGSMEFRGVSFRYPSRANITVLNNLSLTVEAGECVALVGPSGGGKSTIAALLSRFYEVEQGGIFIDGINIKDYDPTWLRQQIALVEQEPIIFSTSIYNNILYGRQDASREEVEAAAKKANAHDFIVNLPDGYQSFVGERGVQVSGGQKQRLAIARAILKDPKILILDEVTSALDAENEKLITSAIDRFMQGRTTVIIAHRLSTVKSADRVLVIDHGQTTQNGTHKHLMNDKKGMYYNLIEHQFSL